MIENNLKGQTEKLGENPKKYRYKFQNRPFLRWKTKPNDSNSS